MPLRTVKVGPLEVDPCQTAPCVLFPIRDVNPRTRFPAVTLLLLAANVVVFLYQWFVGVDVRTAGAIPYEIVHHVDIGPADLLPVPGSIWTSMFLHAGLLHLIGNMWFLWIFGDNVEEAMGSFRFLVFYFVSGTIGALAQSYAMPDSVAPMIGASGAVAGVLGGYVMLFPRARVVTLLLWLPITLPAWFFLGVWFIGQFMLPTHSGVAWMAHVGGFLAGLGSVRLLMRSRPRPPTGPVDVEYLPPGRRPW